MNSVQVADVLNTYVVPGFSTLMTAHPVTSVLTGIIDKKFALNGGTGTGNITL